MIKEELLEVLSIQSYHFKQDLMVEYLKGKISELDCTYEMHEGNLYVKKGNAEKYPCLVAHMDTVHDIESDLSIVEFDGALTGFNRHTMTQVGIGGDDKVGVFICLQALKQTENIKVVFFRDEEVGCIGSNLADKAFFEDCYYVLEFDRRGKSDFVIDANGVILSTKAFQQAILPYVYKYGYSYALGGGTDVQALRQLGIKCSMANLSCGYYNPHLDNEYVVIKDVENTLNLALELLKNIKNSYDFD